MIHYLKISNFWSIRKDLEVNFEASAKANEDYAVTMPDGRRLLTLACISGPSATGKTSILKAFDFVQKLWLRPPSRGEAVLPYETFLFQKVPERSQSRLEMSFYFEQIRHVYQVEFNLQAIVREALTAYPTGIPPVELFNRKSREKVFGKLIPDNKSVMGANIAELGDFVLWFRNFMLDSVSSEENLAAWTAGEIKRSPALNSWINKYMQEVDHRIAEVDPGKASGPKVVYTLAGGSRYAIPAFLESDSTQRFLGLGGILFQLTQQPRLLCIDDLTSALSPEQVKQFVKIYLNETRSSQLLFTANQQVPGVHADGFWTTKKKSDGAIQLLSQKGK